MKIRFHRTARALAAALLAAAAATIGSPSAAFAHSLGPKFFSQQLEVKLDREWLRVNYTIEVPTSVLQREFVDMARDQMDAPPAEIREQFKRAKADALRTGLDVSLNKQHVTLEDDPDVARESRPNDVYFQLYRYALRAGVAGKVGERNTIEIRNRNYEHQETLYTEHIEVASDLGTWKTGLENDDRFFLDPRTSIKWFPSPEHRNLTITVARGALGAGEGTTPGTVAPPGGDDPKRAARTNHEVRRMESFLTAETLGTAVILTGLGVAFFLGCGHALSPGHGKTVVAAYLVGSKGRIRDAVFLGTVVTATHTSVVILLGIVTLSLSQYVLPETIYPYLAFLSGALIVGVGVWTLTVRMRALAEAAPHGHGHGAHHHHGHDEGGHHHHDHAHDHAHGDAHTHDHAAAFEHDHGHAHFPDPSQPVTWRSLLSLGVSGGVVPCPSALVVLLGAVAYHRIAFGLALVLSFSLGLALVLIAIGIAMVLAGNYMQDRFGVSESRWLKRLPVASAVVVILFGLGICGSALVDSGVISINL